MRFAYDFAQVNGKVPMIEFLSEVAKAKSIRELWRGKK